MLSVIAQLSDNSTSSASSDVIKWFVAVAGLGGGAGALFLLRGAQAASTAIPEAIESYQAWRARDMPPTYDKAPKVIEDARAASAAAKLRPSSSTAPFVFICYPRDEAPYVKSMVALFRTNGIGVWFDEDLEYGDTYDVVIAQKIAACAGMVVVMSGSEPSRNVQLEYELAQERNCDLLPISLRKGTFADLTKIHYFRADSGELPDAKFIAAVRKLVRVA